VAALLVQGESQYRALGDACTERAADFSWEQIARRTAEAYEGRLSALRRAA
jgi:hypothetical protein